MRDGLTHFEDWARGQGGGPHAKARKAGATPREVARDHWSFAYDPAADTITMGPFTISISAALPAANELQCAIYAAAQAIDRRNVTEVRSLALQALDAAAILHEPPQGPALVPDSHDPRAWLSFNLNSVPEGEREDLAQSVIKALADVDLRLSSQRYPQATDDMAERLALGESLIVERS